jgi:hypothetical protein
MLLYAELPRVRMRQVVADVVAAVACLTAVAAGAGTWRAVAVAAAPGERISEVGTTIARIPGLGGAGAALAEAGRSQQEVVLGLAWRAGVVVTLAGLAVVLLVHVPRRVAWAREAAAAARLRSRPEDLLLLAHRAVARRPLEQLARAMPDPGAALARGPHLPLARLELESLGLRPPP